MHSIVEASAPGRLLSRSFFELPPDHVAPRLLGKILVRRIENENGTKYLAGRIVEAEAYLGPHSNPPDPAAHAHGGPTPRNSVLFGPAGHAYVYSIYGQYFCMNISCEATGVAGCVLLRALEPLTGLDRMARNRDLLPGGNPKMLTSGPSRLCQALEITRSIHNGLDLLSSASPLQLRYDGWRPAAVISTPRIGINPKNPALHWPLRFAVEGNGWVSGPRKLTGKRVSIA